MGKFMDLIKRSFNRNIVFPLKKRRYYRSLNRQKPSSEEVAEITSQLDENGFHTIENFLPKEDVEKIKTELVPHLDNVVTGENIDQYKCWRFEDYGVYRLLEAENYSETSKLFFDNKLISDVAKSYVDDSATPYQKMSEIRPSVGATSIADQMHFDDWQIRFKAFLYLTDVDDDSAPLVYVPKSHLIMTGIRKKKEFEYFYDGKKGTYGYFTDDEIKEIKDRYGLERVVVKAKAGTLIFVDTRGLHSGTPLRNQDFKRITLSSYFE